jgi:hypothetical protein
MIPEIAAAWSSTVAISKAIASALKTVKDAETKKAIAGIQDSLLDVQSKLLTAQSQYEALAEVKRELEQKIMQYEKWDSESTRYELKELAAGIFVYALKPDETRGEPLHWLCPNCFQQRQKSILEKPGVDYLNYKCHRRSFDVVPTSQYYPQSGGEGFDISTPEGY